MAWGAVLSFANAVLPTGVGLLHFFPVDNTTAPGSDPAVSHLRSALTKAVSAEEYVQRRVPFTWLQVMPTLHCCQQSIVFLMAIRECIHAGKDSPSIFLCISWQSQ
jgi:hypothetical protein